MSEGIRKLLVIREECRMGVCEIYNISGYKKDINELIKEYNVSIISMSSVVIFPSVITPVIINQYVIHDFPINNKFFSDNLIINH